VVKETVRVNSQPHFTRAWVRKEIGNGTHTKTEIKRFTHRLDHIFDTFGDPDLLVYEYTEQG